jgi:hypothetical protein
MSVDRYIDDATQAAPVPSNEADFDRVDRVRAESDAILIGARQPITVLSVQRDARAAPDMPPDLDRHLKDHELICPGREADLTWQALCALVLARPGCRPVLVAGCMAVSWVRIQDVAARFTRGCALMVMFHAGWISAQFFALLRGRRGRAARWFRT